MKVKEFLMCVAVATMPMMFVSCGDDDSTEPGTEQPGSDDPVNPNVTPANEPWAPARQKQYLEDVGVELNSKLQVEDFRHYVELANYVSDRYIDGCDWDNVEDWADDILDDLMSDLIRTEEKTETYNGGSYVYKTIYSYYKTTILVSNFKGHWTARNGKWTRTDADDIQFIFTNKAGQQCVLKLTTSGKTVKAHLFDLDDWGDYNWEQDGKGNYLTTEYADRTQYTLGVPEHITLTLTEGGTQLISENIDINLSSISNEEFDLSRSSLGFTSTTTFNNGYVIKAENVKYTPNSSSAKVTLDKNGERLITASYSCDLSNVPSQTLTSWYDLDDDEIEDLLKNSNATGAFSVNFLGKVQVKGSIKDLHKLVDYLDEADSNEENESAFKAALENANKCYEATIYYNGGTAKQAWLSLKAMPDHWTDWSGTHTEWYAEPTLNFSDGSSYSFDDYFKEDDFKDLIDAVEDQEDTAEDMWD